MRRLPDNPIITPEMVRPSAPGFRVRGAFNPGAVRFDDEILLLLRVAEDCPADEGFVSVPTAALDSRTDAEGEDTGGRDTGGRGTGGRGTGGRGTGGRGTGGRGSGVPQVLTVALDDPDVELKDTRGVVYQGVDYLSTLSHVRLARSRDGVRFTVDEHPFLFPATPEEAFGVEDARVTQLGDVYYINYTCVSRNSWSTALARTRDFEHIERLGIIFHAENKDVSIFPAEFPPSGAESGARRYMALHRPNNSGFGRPSVWLAESPDLIHWGRHQSILEARDSEWEAMKIGGGAPSLLTPEGWLQIYHGKGRDQIYSLFTVLLDRDDPSRVLKRAAEPLLRPETPYETAGFFGNVVFTNGTVALDDGRVLVYYGACDEYTCVAETTESELLASLGG